MRWFLAASLVVWVLSSAPLSVPSVAFADVSRTAERASDSKMPPPKPLPALGQGSVFAFLPSPSTQKAGALKPDEAVRAIAEHLRKGGFRVLAPAQVRAQLASHALEGCKDPTTCDPALALATLRADAVISTAIWQRPSAPAQLVVHVKRQLGYGQAEVDVRTTSGKELRAAAVKALQAALEDSQQTHEISVLIESLPLGASVHVDQTLTATTPARFALLPGSHLISVEASGYVTRAQYLELAEHGTSETRLSLKLNKADADNDDEAQAARNKSEAAAAPPKAAAKLQVPAEQSSPELAVVAEQAETHDHPSVTNYVVAGVLLAIAAPLIANAIYAAATNGKCVGQLDMNGRCGERVTLGPFFYLSAGLGGLAALGGATFLIVQPLEARDYTVTGAQLQVSHRF
jgi:hypothetical protein